MKDIKIKPLSETKKDRDSLGKTMKELGFRGSEGGWDIFDGWTESQRGSIKAATGTYPMDYINKTMKQQSFGAVVDSIWPETNKTEVTLTHALNMSDKDKRRVLWKSLPHFAWNIHRRPNRQKLYSQRLAGSQPKTTGNMKRDFKNDEEVYIEYITGHGKLISIPGEIIKMNPDYARVAVKHNPRTGIRYNKEILDEWEILNSKRDNPKEKVWAWEDHEPDPNCDVYGCNGKHSILKQKPDKYKFPKWRLRAKNVWSVSYKNLNDKKQHQDFIDGIKSGGVGLDDKRNVVNKIIMPKQTKKKIGARLF